VELTAIRLEWTHATAHLKRFEEEAKLLFAESERVGKTLRYEAREWENRGKRLSEEYKIKGEVWLLGATAWSMRQEATYLKMAQAAETKFAMVQKIRRSQEI
jgi:hypothetical protein